MKALMLLMLSMALVIPVVAAQPAFADDPSSIVKKACSDTQDKSLAGCGDTSFGSYAKTIVDIFLYAVGTICVIFTIIGGIRYITSTGDSTRIQKAKDTILYAVIGLIVAILALPIVGFVIARFQ